MGCAPICLFTYDRLKETKQTIDALQKNYLAVESDLIIFSDGWKNDKAKSKVLLVRDFLKTVNGFKSIKIIESEFNKGLAKSIISGVSRVINEYGSAIVVEDDLITSPNFLNFMNSSLTFYKDKEIVFSISGFCLEIEKPVKQTADAFFWGRAHSWGWATWTDRWESIDWDIQSWDKFQSDPTKIKEFNSYGSDLFGMLKKSMLGKINSWYIRFNYNQFMQNRLTIYPFTSKVVNIGFTESATHCDTYNRNSVIFDLTDNITFDLPNTAQIDPCVRKQLYKYKSLSYRVVGKFLTYMMKFNLIKQRTKGLVK